jgi:hypothetical protein
MVESKFKTYGIFAIILSMFLFVGICFFIYVLISVVFFGGHIIPRGTLPAFGAIIFICVFLLLLVTIFYSWKNSTFIIKIDMDSKNIWFKNIITQKKTLYSFNDFDGYLDTFAITRAGSYKVVYLIRNKRAEKILTGFYYSNIDQLQDALSSIPYLGFKKEFSKLARKALMNRPIIDK